MRTALKLYRSLIRAARLLSVKPVGRKIAYNCREVFEIYRDETDPDLIKDLRADGAAALRVISWLNSLPPVSSKSYMIHFSCCIFIGRACSPLSNART